MTNRLLLILSNILIFGVLSNRLDNHINIVISMFIFALLNYLYVFRLLKSFNSMFPILITVLDIVMSKYLYQRYYVQDYNPKEDYYLFLILLLTLLVFSFIDKEALKETDGKVIGFLQNEVLTMTNVYKYFFYFKLVHKEVDQITSINFAEFDKKCFYLFIDFLILNSTAILALLLKIITSVRNKQVYIRSLINIYLQAIFATLLYNILNNRHFTNFIYMKLNQYVPQPFNVIIYNSVPISLDERFKIGMIGVFSYFI